MKMNFNNPVLFKELKLRFRSPKSFIWYPILLDSDVYFCFWFHLCDNDDVRDVLFQT